MKIIQLTDLHIPGMDDVPKTAVSIRQNMNRILKDIHTRDLDALWITGDICLNEPKVEIYEWFASSLDNFHWECPLYYVPGNHDDVGLLQSILCPKIPLMNDELFYASMINDSFCLFLDTSKGYASDDQKGWLSKQLRTTNQPEVYIAMHHPPFLSGVHYMDKNHSLKDMEDFQNIFMEHPEKRIHVFCGHYHVDKIVVHGHVSTYLTPSCYVQVDDRFVDFKVLHTRPGYREVETSHSINLMTSVKYLENGG